MSTPKPTHGPSDTAVIEIGSIDPLVLALKEMREAVGNIRNKGTARRGKMCPQVAIEDEASETNANDK